jgi:CubicO group peptidase (beta-lactamase class C family)
LLTPEGGLYNQGEYFKNVPAGTERDYSNLGAGVAGLVLKSITGKSLAEFSNEEIFNPPFKNKSFIAYPHYGNPQYPDGGLNSSIYDLTKLVKTLFNNGKHNEYSLLSKDSFEEMFSLQLPDSLSTRQRFFWRDNRAGMTGHSGSDFGVFTSFYFDLEKQNEVIILMNRDVDAITEQAMDDIRNKLLSVTEYLIKAE